MHKATIFIIQLCFVVELFGLKDTCGLFLEVASYYIRVGPTFAYILYIGIIAISITICLSKIKVILKLSICQDTAFPLVVTRLAEKATVFISFLRTKLCKEGGSA